VQLVHPSDRALAHQVIERVSKTGTDFEHEYRLLLADGRVKHIHAIAHAVENASGQREFIGAVTDITERKTAEEKVRSQEAELRQMLDLAPRSSSWWAPGVSACMQTALRSPISASPLRNGAREVF